jgi:hypothetical protein
MPRRMNAMGCPKNAQCSTRVEFGLAYLEVNTQQRDPTLADPAYGGVPNETPCRLKFAGYQQEAVRAQIPNESVPIALYRTTI